MSDYIRQYASLQRDLPSKDGWVILSAIESAIKQKIERTGKPLKEWDVQIYRGVLTGFNEAFIIDKNTRDKLLEASPKAAEIIRPILRGRDIKRFQIKFADNWIINSHNGVDSLKIPKVDVGKEFPECLNPPLAGQFSENGLLLNVVFPGSRPGEDSPSRQPCQGYTKRTPPTRQSPGPALTSPPKPALMVA
jgi:hypothetical protein